MTTLTLTPAATFRALHRVQGDVTLGIAVNGAMRARHRVQGDVTFVLLVDAAMRHSFAGAALEGDYYRYFGGAPFFASSVYDDTWDGGPPNTWGGVSFSYAENTPVFSFGNLFFAAGQGENEMIEEKTVLGSGGGLDCQGPSWDAGNWDITDNDEVGGLILDGESLRLKDNYEWSNAAEAAVYLDGTVGEGEDVTYKAKFTYKDAFVPPLTKGAILLINIAGIDRITSGGWVFPLGGIQIRHEEKGTDSWLQKLLVESYDAGGGWVNSYYSPQTQGTLETGIEKTFEIEARLKDGLLSVWVDGALWLEDWDPGLYDDTVKNMGFGIHADTSAYESEIRISDVEVCKEGAQEIVTKLAMYPIRTVMERIGLPVLRFDREGRGKVEPNKIKFIRGVYPIIDAPPGTRLLISIGSQDKINDATAWEGPFPYLVGEDYFVDFTNSGRYVSIRFESLGQPPWQLLGYDLDVEILGER